MSRPASISFSEVKLPDQGVLVVLAEDGPRLGPSAKALDKKSGGTIARAMKIAGFKGKKRTTVDLIVPQGLKLARLLVVGVGKLKDYSETDWLELGGAIRGHLRGREGSAAQILVEAANARASLKAEDIANLGFGALLRGYKFDKYKTSPPKEGDDDKPANNLKRITVLCEGAASVRRIFASRKAIGDGIILARDLVNEPANVLGPEEFANRLKLLSKLGLKVEVLTDKKLADLGMGALLAVGQGSARPCRLVVMQWRGGKAQSKPVAFVGKGVCFDTGGISLKPPAGMGDMKGDMAGAACVAGLMTALAERKAKVNAVGVVGLVENMPGGSATRPGDVVTAMSGKTIEVLNTDAEGRMVLADTLWYTQERFKPVAIVNLATLTGAIMVALGKEYAGLFSNNDALSQKLTKAGEETGEKVWRLPLGPKYDKLIDSTIADIKNIGGRWGGSITAAQFLQRFVKKDVPWAHLDIAGTAMDAPKDEINQSWGSGFGVRLLNRLVADNYEG
jgi:leucyl aminopeptidase